MSILVSATDLRLLAPVVIVFVAALVGVLVEAFAPRRLRAPAHLGVTVLALVGALVPLCLTWGTAAVVGEGSVAVDGATKLWWGLVLGFGLLAALLIGERRLYGGLTAFVPMAAATPSSAQERQAEEAGLEHTEIFPLLLFAVTGMLLFPAATDTLMMFVALEIFSLPLYLMSGLARRRRLMSQEAALKYFLLGSLASAFFLFGAALLYGYSGSFQLSAVAAAADRGQSPAGLLVLGMVMVLVGVLFKVGVVPFHAWTPDVYVGAPTPVTAFMAICTKVAAVGGLVRVLYVALRPVETDWRPLLAVLAVLTMAGGAVLAIVQTDIKRMLAYSSIAHAGFLIVAVVGFDPGGDDQVLRAPSIGAIAFYLVAYGFATLGAFAVVTLVRSETGEQNRLSAWAGLGRRHPVLAGAMTLFMLSFAGIPLTGGFIGKWVAFGTAFRAGYWWLVLVAVLLSLVAAYFYLRVIAVMYLTDEPEPGTDPAVAAAATAEVRDPGLGTWIVIVTGCVATLVLGIVPGWLLDVAEMSSQVLR